MRPTPMSQTSLKDRLLVATLPAEERENGRRLLTALGPIEAKLEDVEAVLVERTRSGIPTIALIGDYLVEGGGKRIRPALLLLGSHMLGYEGSRDVRYAAMIEFLHTATLVHDDIIDDAELRRGRPSVNRRWGNELTVLFGDFLYMKSMEIALEEGDLRVLRLLSDVTLRMTEGEIIGAERRGLLDLTLEGYLDIVRRKTALLFAGACKIPSFLIPSAFGDSAETWGARLWDYGLALGIAFQLQDDLLDYTAKEADLGKPVLSDLKDGRPGGGLRLRAARAGPRDRPPPRRARAGPPRGRVARRKGPRDRRLVSPDGLPRGLPPRRRIRRQQT
jgi:octaprenyl-diphosphate synthase